STSTAQAPLVQLDRNATTLLNMLREHRLPDISHAIQDSQDALASANAKREDLERLSAQVPALAAVQELIERRDTARQALDEARGAERTLQADFERLTRERDRSKARYDKAVQAV